ncbi:hypothetical protein T492DRAFT_955692 [Pavlovales sp. CCMP2436]|nr:hypothetical protein T492DRAFT_955692 [Pavlovales sp. CCMP2436]
MSRGDLGDEAVAEGSDAVEKRQRLTVCTISPALLTFHSNSLPQGQPNLKIDPVCVRAFDGDCTHKGEREDLASALHVAGNLSGNDHIRARD